MSSPDAKPHRPVRSFVRREGRMTPAQRRALEEFWPRYGVPSGEHALDFAALFGRRTEPVLEIGFGNGDALLAMAGAHPERDFLGIEVHRPGVGRLLMGLAGGGLANVRVMCDDAKQVLERQIPDASLSAVHLYFPDPWPKSRHHKRRLVQAGFVELVRRRLALGGLFHLATDWEHYADHMMEVMTAAPGFENTAGSKQYAPRPGHRPLTRFERRGQRLGHGVWDLIFRRVA
jgi:tRNA (guanine-N7-)-methyltransferase